MPHRYFTTEIADGAAVLRGSDAHHLDQIADASQYLYLPEWTPRAVLDWLLYGGEK